MKLAALNDGARVLLGEDFRRPDGGSVDFSGHVAELGWGREISLDPLSVVLASAMRRSEGRGTEGDAWLGPRLHAALRLTRAEASEKRVWSYLSCVAFPAYVRWRWAQKQPEDPIPLDRFMGAESANAFAKLWWATELARNGSDYQPAVDALRLSGFFWWQKIDFAHNKPGLLAAVRLLSRLGRTGAGNAQVLEMSKCVNLAVTTKCLDAIAPSPPTDAIAMQDWITERIDETLLLGESLPMGPDEAGVPDVDIEAVRAQLEEWAGRFRLSELRTRGKTIGEVLMGGD